MVVLFSLLCVLCCAVGLIACSADDGGDTGVHGGRVQYNDKILYNLSYTSDEESPNGRIDETLLHSDMDFQVGEIYYMVLDFTVSSFVSDGWEESFRVRIAVSTIVIDVTLEEAATGNFTEREEGGVKDMTMTYRIPEKKTQPRDYRVTIRLLFEEKGLANFGISFYGDKESSDDAFFSEQAVGIGVSTDLVYTLNEDGASYSVKGYYNMSGDVVISPRYWGLPVTELEQNAFLDCGKVSSVFIPDSITSIGRSAFSGCSAAVQWGDNPAIDTIGENAFRNYKGKSITIPDSVKYIREAAFMSSNLESITVPDSVYSIGDSAFLTCSSLASVTIGDLMSIGEQDFSSCPQITSVVFGTNRWSLTVGKQAFANLPKLKAIRLPFGSKSIGEQAFSGCTQLATVELPNGLTAIGDRVFDKCIALLSIALPKSVESVSANAFSACASLARISVAEENEHYASEDGILYDKLKTELIYAPHGLQGSVTIPDSVTALAPSAFYERKNLTGVVFGEGSQLTSIGNFAFYQCKSLISITIPVGVTYLGLQAFDGCSSLTAAVFKSTGGWWISENRDDSNGRTVIVTNSETAARYLRETYKDFHWRRN